MNDDSSEVLDALPRGQAPDQVGANVQTDTPRPVTADAQPAAPRPFIEWVATRKIKGFCGTIDEAGDYYSEVYAGNASLSESITADYHGRFLIELIQNAYDVHPRDRSDGEIEVVLDIRAGAYGTLYVANRGAGFSTKDVNALCDMGLSSKPPGESIGNKGLGFRSIHHVTDQPFIYSQSAPISAKPSFDGFCFGFAEDVDLDRMIFDPRHRALAKRDLPLFHVPRWLTDQPAVVTAFAERGFATVISLSLRDEAARGAVDREIAAIRDQTVPLLLFLDRLQHLTVRTTTGDAEPIPLTRTETAIIGAGPRLSIADLGVAGRFLIARKAVAEPLMMAAIADGVAHHQLHKHWKNWEGDGEVALAVRIDGGPVVPRLYTFLPMGAQATAPFSGYLHGSFFPTSNRKGLDAKIKLNELLLDEATSLTASVISWLSRRPVDAAAKSPDAAEMARAAVDLLAWRRVDSLDTGPSLDLVTAIARKITAATAVQTFDEAPVIPCLGSDTGDHPIVWCASARARRWRYELPSFSASIVAAQARAVGFAPIWPGLGERIERLSQYLSAHAPRYVDTPTVSERVNLACRIASLLVGNALTPVTQWAGFYRDLVVLLDKSANALAGREILLCGDGKLHRAMTPATEPTEGRPKRRRRRDAVEASVFSPPARRAAATLELDELTPPADLKENFAFLSDRLDWYGDLAVARSFLENAKLVFTFDREAVLAQLSQVLRADIRNGIRSTGLHWAFQIWRRPREAGRPFKLQPQHRFFVPTMSGEFIEASGAVFSEGWPDETLGRLLQRFLSSAPPDSGDLKELRAHRLAPYSHYAFKRGKVNQWVLFLTELGVQRGLYPVAKKLTSPLPAGNLQTFRFCAALGIPSSAAQLWKADIDAWVPGATILPYSTDYLVRGNLWWLPGQGEYLSFTNECRELYAQLVIAWIEHAVASHWQVEVHHYHFTSSDTRAWPTPLAAFLRSGPWIPADEPTSEGPRRIHVPPSEIWLAPEGGDRFPTFLRRPAPPIMRALERASSKGITVLREQARLRILNHPETLAEQAEFLGRQYADAGVDRYFERHFLNLYHRTWLGLIDRYGTPGAGAKGLHPLTHLVVRRGGETAVVTMPGRDRPALEQVYVRDCDDETAASLIESSGRPLFDPRIINPVRTGVLLRALFAQKVRLLSEVNYSVRVDGQAVGAGDVAPVLERCPWLKVLTAVAMEALKGTELQRLPSNRSAVIDRLDRVLLQTTGSIAFKIDGIDLADSFGRRRAFALKLTDGQPIVVTRTDDLISWDSIDASLEALCEAIDQPALVPHLRVMIFTLDKDAVPVDETPSTDRRIEALCGLLRLDDTAARAVLETLGTRLERHLPWLRALIHMATGSNGVDAFGLVEAEVVQDVGRLRAALAPAFSALGLDADNVLDACKRSLTVSELRDVLRLDFEALNRSLLAIGEKPDTYPDLHASLVVNYVHEHEVEIIDAIRGAHVAALAKQEPVPEYAQQREEVRHLLADPAWLLVYHDVPTACVAAHVDAWLGGCGAAALGSNPHKLQPLEEVRRINAGAVRLFARTARPLLKAWCSKSGTVLPQLWRETDDVAGALRSALDAAGAFDFAALDAMSLLQWATALGIWPTSMPLTIDRGILGIAENDLEAEKNLERKLAETRKREARSVWFNGREVDPESVDWEALAAELASGLSKKMLATPIGLHADLQPAQRKSSGPGVGPSFGSKNPPAGHVPHAPSQKTNMIGRLGEIAVYKWLTERLPKQNIDAAWVSENAQSFTGRKGSDRLGYDFEIRHRNQPWQIEVKASLDDPCAFLMGETEVRAARATARTRKGHQYAIAYVSYVGEPARTRVEMLPNPMSEEGEAVLNLIGEGLRYRFDRTS